VNFLKKAVPVTVKALFNLELTFCQQRAEAKVKATLYIERKVPALRVAVDHWASLSLLSKTTTSMKATAVRRERRRLLAKHKADKLREEQIKAIEQEFRGVDAGNEAVNLLHYIQVGHN